MDKKIIKSAEDIKCREDALEFVASIGKGDRQINYGKPENNFKRIADLVKVYREGKECKNHDELDVAYEMILMKVARLMNNPHHKDSVVDIIGYALCAIDIICSRNVIHPLPVLTEGIRAAFDKTINYLPHTLLNSPEWERTAREQLQQSDEKYKFAAVDKNGAIYGFTCTPIRGREKWVWDLCSDYIKLGNTDLSDIDWKDTLIRRQ